MFTLSFSLLAIPLSYRNYRQKWNSAQLSYGSYGISGDAGKCASIKCISAGGAICRFVNGRCYYNGCCHLRSHRVVGRRLWVSFAIEGYGDGPQPGRQKKHFISFHFFKFFKEGNPSAKMLVFKGPSN